MGPLFQGGLPPLPGSGGPNLQQVLLNMVFAVLWSIVASVGFAAAIAIGLKVFSLLTPGFNEWEELRKGNNSVAILWAAFVIAVAIVVVAVLLK
jgi:uncharacterized membrane protein YjfL (UPF0719 family)